MNLHAGQCIGYGPPEEILPKARDIRARGGSLTVTPESEDKILPVLTLEAGQENHRRGSLSLDVLWFYVRSIGLALFICTVAAVALMQVHLNDSTVLYSLWEGPAIIVFVCNALSKIHPVCPFLH